MAADHKNKGKGTPGRPKKKGNQYFEIGKVGRKTGITLEDKGIRDEHGLEPVSHIFSSPATSPQRNGDKTLTSSDMLVQESSAPDVDTTLHSRKTPRLPPPRASTPRHTNIGSPKRMSTGRPVSQRLSVDLLADGSPTRPRTLPANRVLDFGADTVHKSIEATSPFKPKRTLRRSVGPAGPSLPKPSASPAQDSKVAESDVQSGAEVEAEAGAEATEHEEATAKGEPQVVSEEQPDNGPLNHVSLDDGPIMVGEDDDDDAMPQQPSPTIEVPSVVEEEEEATPMQSKANRARESGASVTNSQLAHGSATRNRKRDRTSLEEGEASASQLQSEAAGPSQKKRRGRPCTDKSVIVHQDDGDAAIDPSLLAHGDQYIDEVEAEDDEAAEAEDQVPELPVKAKGNGKGKAPVERDPNRRMKSSSVQLNDSPSKMRNSRAPSRGGSVGPVSNVNLRATTPFEDANQRTSRYGRNLMGPLQYWKNESKIYKNGELEGVVRADEVEAPKKKKPKRKTKNIKKGISRLDDVDEESETESVMPDEWEDDVGVIPGQIAAWDPVAEQGDVDNLIREDLGFASSAIVTRDVANSEFKYAKVMTMPFFGSGIVELPPEGFKRAKNSRKMQMCFFVHEGKVMVEIGAASGKDMSEFAVSKGGAWVVPRGNNYAISNESSTKTAKVFFAQGCEIAPSMEPATRAPMVPGDPRNPPSVEVAKAKADRKASGKGKGRGRA